MAREAQRQRTCPNKNDIAAAPVSVDPELAALFQNNHQIPRIRLISEPDDPLPANPLLEAGPADRGHASRMGPSRQPIVNGGGFLR